MSATSLDTRGRWAPFGTLLLVMLLSSLDQTIVLTALPTIVAELGGVSDLSFVVTAYLLATTVSAPLYGKLSDLYGRRRLLQIAVTLFLAGSLLCSLAPAIEWLIAFRIVQGLGGGGLMVVAIAAVGDIIPPRERGSYQGYIGATYGVATVLGPLLGGYLTEALDWRWIFTVNLPFGVLALWLVTTVLGEGISRRTLSLDLAGAALLAMTLVGIVLFASFGGKAFAWVSWPAVLLSAVSLAALLGFVAVERRAAEPVLAPHLFRNRTFTLSASGTLVVGLALFGCLTYVPLYLQVVRGMDPAASGLQMAPIMVGFLVTSILSGRIVSRTGRYKAWPVAGTATMTAALLLLATLDAATSLWLIGAYMLLLGLGLGMVMQILVLAVQNAVPYEHLGAGTAGNALFRQIGGAVGVALFGAVLTAALPAQDASVQAYAQAFPWMFGFAAAVTFTAFLLLLFLPEIPLRATVSDRKEA